MFHSTLGRWMTEDPIGFEGGDDFYRFETNDPLSQLDPSGLDPKGTFNVNMGSFTGNYVSGLSGTVTFTPDPKACPTCNKIKLVQIIRRLDSAGNIVAPIQNSPINTIKTSSETWPHGLRGCPKSALAVSREIPLS
ncbi:hypothetical protein [Fimbriiglobus ruber]|uniref:hypothetical protein n=1 Tax=Fimbriiglobus ruber TaxID=1908690 RepID=UPI00117B21F2|nr:hypothetical protein [Fimbriiglobus ruber]